MFNAKDSYQTRIDQYESVFGKIYEIDAISSTKTINGIVFIAVLKPYGSFSVYSEFYKLHKNDTQVLVKEWDKNIINQFLESQMLAYYGEHWI